MHRNELTLLSVALLAPANGAQGISRLSIAPGDLPANGFSTLGATTDAISGDGRLVAFESTASNFGAPAGTQPIFLALVPPE